MNWRNLLVVFAAGMVAFAVYDTVVGPALAGMMTDKTKISNPGVGK